MARRNPESRDFAIGLTVTCLIVTAFFAYSNWYAPASQTTRVDEHRRSTANSPAVIATVYECNGEDGRVLSDKPCGDDARVREVMQPNLMPGSANTQSARPSAGDPAKRARTPHASIESSANRSDKVCASIDAEIDRINARMRHKYSSDQAEVFRRRLRELSDQRWYAKCPP
jgi:hypothetical protein